MAKRPFAMLVTAILGFGSLFASPVVAAPSQCRPLLYSGDNRAINQASAQLNALLNKEVFVELTMDEYAQLTQGTAGTPNSVGMVVKAQLVSYSNDVLPLIGVKVGRKNLKLSMFVPADSSQVLGGKVREEILASSFRLRDVQPVENGLTSESIIALKNEIDAVVNSLAHEAEFEKILKGPLGIGQLLKKISGVYTNRAWLEREQNADELVRLVKDGNISGAVEANQELFTKVETAAVVLLRLRPLYAALDQLANSRPELIGQIEAIKVEAEAAMLKHADILGSFYADYMTARLRLDALIIDPTETSRNKDISDSMAQYEIESNPKRLTQVATEVNDTLSLHTDRGIESVIAHLGILTISQEHFPLLYRDNLNFNNKKAVEWVRMAYEGRPVPGSNQLPFAAMAPRRASVRRQAFDQMVSGLLNIITHPVMLNTLLGPVDAIPSHPSLVDKKAADNANQLTRVTTGLGNFLRKIPAAIGHIPHQSLAWMTDFLRDHRSRNVHGPGLLALKQKLGDKPVDLGYVQAFMREAASHGGRGIPFMETAARDFEFGTTTWVEIRNFLKDYLKSENGKLKTEGLEQLAKDMETAEKQQAKLGFLSATPKGALDLFLKAGGSFVVFEAIVKPLFTAFMAIGLTLS